VRSGIISRVEHVERVGWLMKDRSRKVCDWMVRGMIAVDINMMNCDIDSDSLLSEGMAQLHHSELHQWDHSL